MNANSKEDRRCVKTKKAIKSALASLMTEKEISEISITEVSRVADINRKTFYAHYTNVYDVLDDIENDLVTTLSGMIDNMDFSQDQWNPTPVFMDLASRINEDVEFYKYLFEGSSHSALFEKISSALKQKLINTLQSQTGLSPDCLDVGVDFIAGGTLAVYRTWLAGDHRTPLENVSEHVTDLTFEGFNGLLDSCNRMKTA